MIKNILIIVIPKRDIVWPETPAARLLAAVDLEADVVAWLEYGFDAPNPAQPWTPKP